MDVLLFRHILSVFLPVGPNSLDFDRKSRPDGKLKRGAQNAHFSDDTVEIPVWRNIEGRVEHFDPGGRNLHLAQVRYLLRVTFFHRYLGPAVEAKVDGR